MSLLIAPLLAQLVTVGISDRTEARYVAPYDYKYEGSTSPGVRLSLRWPRYDFSLGYVANLTLAPLESSPRDLLVYHRFFVKTAYRHRRTSVTLGSTGSFGDMNFRTGALRESENVPVGTDNQGANPGEQPKPAMPAPGSPKPGSPTPGSPAPPTSVAQPRVGDGAVRYGMWDAVLGVGHQLTQSTALAANATYTIAGSLEAADRGDYPLTRGTVVGLTGTHLKPWSARDSFTTLITLQQAWSSVGTYVTSLVGSETWTHYFAPRTSGALGAGISMTREPYDVYSVYNVYPTFTAVVVHAERLARGTLNLVGSVYSAPALDPLRATVDPRIGTACSISWSRDRFSTGAAGTTALSIAKEGNDAGAFNTTQASAFAAYRVTDWLIADVGGRVAEQEYQDAVTIPLTYAAFVGLAFGLEAPLHGKAPWGKGQAVE